MRLLPLLQLRRLPRRRHQACKEPFPHWGEGKHPVFRCRRGGLFYHLLPTEARYLTSGECYERSAALGDNSKLLLDNFYTA